MVSIIDGKWSNGSYSIGNAGTAGKSTVGYRSLGEGVFYAEIKNTTGTSNRGIGVTTVLDKGWTSGGSFVESFNPIRSTLTTNTTYGILLDLRGSIGKFSWNINGGNFTDWLDVVSLSGSNILSTFRIWTYGNASANASAEFIINSGQSPFLTSELLITGKASGAIVYSFDGSLKYSQNKILFSSSDGKARSIGVDTYIKNIIPTMTSDILPSGVASASSVYSSTYPAWKAFDKVIANSWNTPVGNVVGEWISYQFSSALSIGGYSLSPFSAVASNLNQMPKDWTFEGSNDDGNTWVILDSRTSQSWTLLEYKNFYFGYKGEFKKYRLKVISNNGHTNICIGEIEMFEVNPRKITSIPSTAEQSFINHGMSLSNLISTDLTANFTEKHYIQDTTTALDSGKVFEHVLDTNKVLKTIKIN